MEPTNTEPRPVKKKIIVQSALYVIKTKKNSFNIKHNKIIFGTITKKAVTDVREPS
jgi:hypothetical protein